jgi:hypothetical protein
MFFNSHSSSLILAAIQGHADVCRLLIASRAEIDAKDAEYVQLQMS